MKITIPFFRGWRSFILAAVLTSPLLASNSQSADGWLHWRGPQQMGVSLEKGLPDQIQIEGENHLWTVDFSGRSTAAVANGKLYILGYEGEGPDLQEVLACFNSKTGERLWDRRFNDFLSDIIYTRYSTSNPTIDPETGNIYIQGTQGILACFTPDGEMVWKRSMMESYGRMTFPNGRTASPVIDRDLVITHGITSNWGTDGPGADRFYAFDKKTGELVWASTPGARPRDSSYSPPLLAWWNGKRVFYSTTGDGSIVCVNARTGEPIWRVTLSQGGMNTAVLLHNDDKLITIHGTENLDTTEVGRMLAVRIPTEVPETERGAPAVFEMADLELWRNPLVAATSSPILVGDTVYQVTETGDLCAVDAETGEIQWRQEIGRGQRNSSLVFADGKLFVPMLEDPEAGGSGTKGAFYIIRPGDTAPEILSKVQLDGRCFGSPAIWDGKIYLQTTENLYAFGKDGANGSGPERVEQEKWPEPGPAAQLQVIPAEVVVHPGEAASFRVRALDAKGFLVEDIDPKTVQWESYIPPTARVRARLNGSFDDEGRLVADEKRVISAGAFKARVGDAEGFIRARVLLDAPMEEDFQSFELTETHAQEGVAFAYPPLPWIGARFKFEVRERDGSHVLAKTIDNRLFQRAFVYMGYPSMKNYTVEADVMTDGDRRRRSEVGLLNQRYCIVLKGNAQQLEVNSNLERIRESVPFQWSPNEWYRLKTRVDVAEDGSGVVRAKAWKRGEPEPEAWTIEVRHRNAHRNGSPGLFGFSPQDMRVYIDNLKVSQND